MNKTKTTVFCALFAALICIGWMISIPIGPVPIVLQNALAILTGMLLGPLLGGIAVIIFLVLGIVGLPVFSGGKSGLAVILGPTGGYLLGYLLGAIIAGLILHLLLPRSSKNIKATFFIISLAALIGMLSIYIPGLIHIKQVLSWTWPETFAKGFAPYIIVDLVKVAILIPITFKLKPIVRRYLQD